MQTLENEIRSAVAATDTGPDETDRREMEKIFGRVPFRTTWFNQRHAKHAIALESVFEHFAITRLENIKRQECVRKEDCARQRHHRHLIG